VTPAVKPQAAARGVEPVVARDLKEEMGKMMDEPTPKRPKGSSN
jgi:hypothetical protein